MSEIALILFLVMALLLAWYGLREWVIATTPADDADPRR